MRLGLEETRGAQILGLTHFSPNTAPLRFPQFVWGRGKEVTGWCQGTWEEKRAKVEEMIHITLDGVWGA